MGRIRRNEAANWSALYAEGFSSWRKSSLMAARTHRPAIRRRLSFGLAGQSPAQMRDCIRGSSLARRVSATPPLPHQARRQFQERVHPNPCRTKATELFASASCAASTTKHKTSSQSDSQKHVQSAGRERLPQISERPHTFSGCDYRRPAQNLAIEEGHEFSAARKQIGRRYTPKGSRAAGRVR